MRPSTRPNPSRVAIKLIALDIDRTTLTDSYQLLPNVISAVAAAQAAGILVVPATARSPRALVPIAGQLAIDGPCVCFNGAWVGTPQSPKADHQTVLNSEHLPALLDAARAAELNPMWFTASQCYAFEDGPLVQRERVATGLDAQISPLGIEPGLRICKVLCLDTARDGRVAELSGRFDTRFDFVSSGAQLTEVVAPGVTKQSAMAWLTDTLGIDATAVCAIGDSENDFALLSWAGTAVAMGNAEPRLKDIADFVTASNHVGGAGLAIQHLLAINSQNSYRETIA